MDATWTGRNEITEESNILGRRETSRTYLKARKSQLSENYSGDTAVVVTTDEGPELAAVYRSDSENNWGRLVLEQIRETYSELAYLSAVERRLE